MIIFMAFIVWSMWLSIAFYLLNVPLWWAPGWFGLVMAITKIILTIHDDIKSKRKELYRQQVRRNMRLIERAEDQHFFLMYGCIEGDLEALNLGIYGNYQPEDLDAHIQ